MLAREEPEETPTMSQIIQSDQDSTGLNLISVNPTNIDLKSNIKISQSIQVDPSRILLQDKNSLCDENADFVGQLTQFSYGNGGNGQQ